MITCTFEDGGRGYKRHVTLDAIIEQEEKLLLARRATHMLLEGNKWALPGGFLDRDENLEKGVCREVLEESGHNIENLQLFMINSNPDRPKEDRQNVNCTFIATPLDKIQEPDSEVSEIKWFPIASLPKEDEMAFDHHMILTKYIEYRKEKFKLPILI